MPDITLPKQWKHWLKKYGFQVEGLKGTKSKRNRKQRQVFYFVGKGRHWRINCYGQFQISCPSVDFDKWGNSVVACVNYIPQTEEEFVKAVKMLILVNS